MHFEGFMWPWQRSRGSAIVSVTKRKCNQFKRIAELGRLKGAPLSCRPSQAPGFKGHGVGQIGHLLAEMHSRWLSVVSHRIDPTGYSASGGAPGMGTTPGHGPAGPSDGRYSIFNRSVQIVLHLWLFDCPWPRLCVDSWPEIGSPMCDGRGAAAGALYARITLDLCLSLNLRTCVCCHRDTVQFDCTVQLHASVIQLGIGKK